MSDPAARDPATPPQGPRRRAKRRPAAAEPLRGPAPDGRGTPGPPDLRPQLGGVLAVARKYGYDGDHARQVADLALRLFAALPEAHGLGADWAPLLEHAALLHDIGYFIRARGHHRHSRYLIRHDALLADYPRPWLDVVALIAHNHRKRPRRAPGGWARGLGEAALALAALLRIADGLDYGHDGGARIALASIRRGGVEIAVSGVPLGSMARILRRKSRLFSARFALPVTFVSGA